jgi:hypothetical protein
MHTGIQMINSSKNVCNHSLPFRNSIHSLGSSPMVKSPAVTTTEAPCHTVYCFVDPCAFAKCEKHPEAVCQ